MTLYIQKNQIHQLPPAIDFLGPRAEGLEAPCRWLRPFWPGTDLKSPVFGRWKTELRLLKMYCKCISTYSNHIKNMCFFDVCTNWILAIFFFKLSSQLNFLQKPPPAGGVRRRSCSAGRIADKWAGPPDQKARRFFLPIDQFQKDWSYVDLQLCNIYYNILLYNAWAGFY